MLYDTCSDILNHSYNAEQCLLLQLEDAQGAPDAEAQQALRTLQEQMKHLEHAQRSAVDDSASQPNAEAPSDIEIASSIDRYACALSSPRKLHPLCCTGTAIHLGAITRS